MVTGDMGDGVELAFDQDVANALLFTRYERYTVTLRLQSKSYPWLVDRFDDNLRENHYVCYNAGETDLSMVRLHSEGIYASRFSKRVEDANGNQLSVLDMEQVQGGLTLALENISASLEGDLATGIDSAREGWSNSLAVHESLLHQEVREASREISKSLRVALKSEFAEPLRKRIETLAGIFDAVSMGEIPIVAEIQNPLPPRNKSEGDRPRLQVIKHYAITEQNTFRRRPRRKPTGKIETVIDMLLLIWLALGPIIATVALFIFNHISLIATVTLVATWIFLSLGKELIWPTQKRELTLDYPETADRHMVRATVDSEFVLSKCKWNSKLAYRINNKRIEVREWPQLGFRWNGVNLPNQDPNELWRAEGFDRLVPADSHFLRGHQEFRASFSKRALSNWKNGQKTKIIKAANKKSAHKYSEEDLDLDGMEASAFRPTIKVRERMVTYLLSLLFPVSALAVVILFNVTTFETYRGVIAQNSASFVAALATIFVALWVGSSNAFRAIMRDRLMLAIAILIVGLAWMAVF